MATTLLAIDWDHDTLRIVQADVSRTSLKITKALSVLLADDVDIDRPDSLGPFIARVLAEQKIVTRTAVIDLPRDQVVLQKVPLPPTPEVDLAASVLFQVGRELPFPLDDAVVDFAVSRRNARGLAVEAVAAAVRSEILARLTQTCEKAGLILRRVGLRPYANMVAARYGRKPDDESRMLFVDIGPELTEIDIFRGSSLVFSRSASVSVPIIPDDEVQSMEQGGALPEHLQPVLDEVMVEVARSLQAYRMTEPDSILAESVVAGGTGLEPAVAVALRERSHEQVVLFDPSGNLSLPVEQGQALRAFAAALGLAIGSGRPGVFHLDFLHPKNPEDVRRVRHQQRLWGGIAAGVALLLLVGWPVYARIALNWENEAFEKNVLWPKEKEAKELAAFKVTLDQLVAWRDGEFYWLDELQRLAKTLPDASELYLTSLSASDTGEFSLAGRVRDRAVCYRLANDITQSGVIAAKLGDVKEAPEARGSNYPYRFDMKLEVKNRLSPGRIRSNKQSYSLPGTGLAPASAPAESAPEPGTQPQPADTPVAPSAMASNEAPADPTVPAVAPSPPAPTAGKEAGVPADVAGTTWRSLSPQRAEQMIQTMLKANNKMTRSQALKRAKMQDFEMSRRAGNGKRAGPAGFGGPTNPGGPRGVALQPVAPAEDAPAPAEHGDNPSPPAVPEEGGQP